MHFPFFPLVIDAVSVRSGPRPREKDRPQEGRCLWRDNIQESKLFSLYLPLCLSQIFVFNTVCRFFLHHDFTNYFPPTPYSVVLLSVLRLQTTSSALQGAIQLGIGYTVGNLSSKPERDVLMQDFYVVESIFFPRCVFRGFVVVLNVCMCVALFLI